MDSKVDENSADPWLDRTFDGYRIEERIGSGSMSSVYRGTQLSLERPVAIKVLPEEVVGEFQFRERFKREADALSRLQHGNVVTIFNRGEVDERPYLVMEYIEGQNLRQILEQGPLGRDEALRYVNAILAALNQAHELGVVHRDVKPENVLITNQGRVKLVDFGLGLVTGPSEMTRLTHTRMTLGTLNYMAPEQREKSKTADERSDLYSTGVVLYEMLTGELPIGLFPDASARRPGECDARIDAIVEKCLDKDPSARYQRASEMSEDVSSILSSRSVPSSGLAAPPPDPEPPAPDLAPARSRAIHHLQNLATMNEVLGLGLYLVGFVLLFGGFDFIDELWGDFFGKAFFLYWVLGWVFRRNALRLRRYDLSARKTQTVLAVLCVLSVVLIPAAIYSAWVLRGPCNARWYEEEHRYLGSA